MLPRNILSKTGLIYVILDKETIDRHKLDIFKLAEELSYAGADIFQLRFINETDRATLNLATALRKIIHKNKKMFIVNNRTDIAYISKADGVHLGADDINIKSARSILGPHKLIGKTIHSAGELKELNRKRVDYLSVGPVFRTKTKPGLKLIDTKALNKIIKETNKPLFAIGGINLENLHHLIKRGVRNISICQGVILEKNINKAIKELKKCLANPS